MKKIILLILVIIFANNINANDLNFVEIINQYRLVNGKTALVYSETLNELSKTQTSKQFKLDYLSHSNSKTNECITSTSSITPTQEDKYLFGEFLNKYFNISYEDPANNKDKELVKTYILLYVLYLWDKSPKHRLIILDDKATKFSINTEISDIIYKSNEIIINGRIYKYNRFINHFDVKIYSTLNII